MTPSPDILISLYTTMLKIRKAEEKLAELLRIPGEIICPVHLYLGEEAVATGVCANLNDADYVFSTHRSHGHFLAKGGNLNKMMAEIYGKAAGSSKGRGGSMHLAEPEKGLPGSSAIVAGSIPLAAGTAYASKLKRNKSVSVAFFGDGASNEGVLYETMNLAVLNKLPVIFVCENNFYSTHLSTKSCLGDTDIKKKAEAFGMVAHRIDGNNAVEVYETALQAVSQAREGKGPTFIEALTYRWLGHVGPSDDIDKGLRSREELESWKKRCPIKQIEATLLNAKIISPSGLSDLKNAVSDEIKDAVAFAKNSPYPDKSELLLNVYKGR